MPALLAAGAVLVLLDSPASLTDEDDYLPHALDDLLSGRNPYATRHSGERTVTGPWGGERYDWTTTYPYLPAVALIQVPGVDYRWTALLAYGALLLALRDRPLAFLAFGNPLVLRLAASGFNDFVVLALAAWAVRSGRAWPAWLAAGGKQLALPVLLLHHALRGEWRRAAGVLGAAVAFSLPFVLWDASAFWHSAVAQHLAGPDSKLPNVAAHVNYALYPLFALVVVLPAARRAVPAPPERREPMLEPSVAVVLPALDEAGAVAGVVRGFRAVGARVVVVDNGSVDATVDVAAAEGAVVVREPRRGYGAACLAGLAHLRADPPDVVAFADCDGTVDPGDLARLVAPVARGEADLALGRRARLECGALLPHQRAGNAAAALIIRLVHGLRVRDVPPFRAARWDFLERLRLREGTYGLPVETVVLAHRAGGRVVEVDVAYRRRAGGESKIAGTLRGSLAAGWTMLTLAVRLRFRRTDA